MEAGGADELVSDLDDAGPVLVLQLLLVLRALLLCQRHQFRYDLVICHKYLFRYRLDPILFHDGICIASHIFGGFWSCSVGVAVSQVHR